MIGAVGEEAFATAGRPACRRIAPPGVPAEFAVEPVVADHNGPVIPPVTARVEKWPAATVVATTVKEAKTELPAAASIRFALCRAAIFGYRCG